MLRTQGIIKYYNNWVMAWLVEDDLLKYYRGLLPKAWGVCPPMRPAHVSIVRLFESVPNRSQWGKYDGQSIVVEYEPGVQSDGLYYWLDTWSDEIGFIRRSLGLSTFRERDGFSDFGCYHITIGNVKNGIQT
jgi:hypothetical protein